MEESQGLITKFRKLMEDFCVPFDTTMIENFTGSLGKEAHSFRWG